MRRGRRPRWWPKTADEWCVAVHAAAGARMIHDCKLYGLLEGGPRLNIDRADEILDEGRRRGVLADPDEALTYALAIYHGDANGLQG